MVQEKFFNDSHRGVKYNRLTSFGVLKENNLTLVPNAFLFLAILSPFSTTVRKTINPNAPIREPKFVRLPDGTRVRRGFPDVRLFDRDPEAWERKHHPDWTEEMIQASLELQIKAARAGLHDELLNIKRNHPNWPSKKVMTYLKKQGYSWFIKKIGRLDNIL